MPAKRKTQAVCLSLVLVLTACGSGSDTEEAPSAQASTTVAPTTEAPGPRTTRPATNRPATTEPEATPPRAAAPAVLPAQDVYSLVAPSIPLIETPAGTGSGVLIEGGYVVTNHHVVWPYDRVWVVFPDGTELAEVPVLGSDAFADLAVLGPVGVSAPPLSFGDGEGMDPGSDVYLIGYPAETDLFPQPTITSGVLSRVREWDLYGLTLLQSDADIAGGQSGGALVNTSGEVVGISTWSFSDAGFSVATSAADSAEIVQTLLRDHEQLGPPGPVYGDASGSREVVVDLRNGEDTGLYWFEGTAGSTIEVAIDGASDGVLAVAGPTAHLMEVDDTLEGLEHGIVELPVDGPYVVVVSNYAGEIGEASRFTLTSSVELSPFADPDDGRLLVIGEPLGAVLDYHWDVDWYELFLEQGDSVVVWTEAIATDTAVFIMPGDAGYEQMVWDDDSGAAVVGDSTNAWLHYTAPSSGRYFVVVGDVLGQSGGGYFVGVERADPLDEPVAVADDGEELRFDVSRGTTWRDLFDAFEPDEQDCIRREFGDGALLQDVLATEVLLGEGGEDDVAGILLCLRHENRREAYIAALVAALAGEGVILELEDVACLREVFAGEDGAAFLTALITAAEIEEEFGALSLLFLSCFPEEVFSEAAGSPERAPVILELSDVAVGELVWQYSIPPNEQPFLGVSRVHPPRLEGGTLYLPASDGAVYALSTLDGSPLWTYRTHPVGTPHVPTSLRALDVTGGVVSVVTEELVHGIDAGTGGTLWLHPGEFAGAPGVGDGVLLVQSGLALEAVDIESGLLHWSSIEGSPTRHAPVVHDGAAYFGADGVGIAAREALTGELEWWHGIDTNIDLSPVVADGIVYAALFDNTVFALDAHTGLVIWQNRIPGRAAHLLELVDGLLYLSTEVLYALDPASGEIVWRSSTDGSGGPHLPFSYPWTQTEPFFTVDRGVVYYGSDLGEVFALEAATGRLLWEYQTLSGRPAAPTASGDLVLLGSLGAVFYALDAATGQLVWYYPVTGAVIAAPLVADDVIYLTTSDGQVHAVRAPS